jgi:cardiolipin synthase
MVEFLLRNWLTVPGWSSLLGLGVYVMASRALYQRRHPSAAIAWVVMLTLLPYVALAALTSCSAAARCRDRQGLAAGRDDRWCARAALTTWRLVAPPGRRMSAAERVGLRGDCASTATGQRSAGALRSLIEGADAQHRPLHLPARATMRWAARSASC